MPKIVFDAVSFSYGNKPIFDGFSRTFSGFGVTLITGQSGCGKTTLLRLVAGLEKPRSGSISVSDPCAFAFQEYRLFNTLSALQNVLCVCDPKSKEEAAQNRTEALSLLRSLGLSEDDADLLPDELSGGMKQRVSLARALFSPYKIKLLDEVTKEMDTASVALALEQIARYSSRSLILFSTHHPEDCASVTTDRLELPLPN